MKTGVVASKLAVAAFVIPYIFVLSPALLMINTTPGELIWALTTSIIGMVGLGASMIGYFLANVNPLIRVVFFAGGLLMIDPGLFTDVIGFGMLGSAMVFQWMKRKRQDNKQ